MCAGQTDGETATQPGYARKATHTYIQKFKQSERKTGRHAHNKDPAKHNDRPRQRLKQRQQDIYNGRNRNARRKGKSKS